MLNSAGLRFREAVEQERPLQVAGTINLGDGSVYRVAEILTARGVPFIFVTGYDSDSVDSRFQDIPVLQKPIERQMLQKIFVAPTNRAIAS